MKQPFKIGQVWEWDDGKGFTLKVVSLKPLKFECVKVGDSMWILGEVNELGRSGVVPHAHVILDFNNYLKQVERL